MNKPSRTIWVFSILALGVLLLVIALDWLAFQYLAHENYFVWYVKNGAVIGILVSFIALIWEGLSFRNDLLSAQPLYYLRGCMALLSAFYWSLAAHLEKTPRPQAKSSDTYLVPEFAFPLDRALSAVILLVVAVFGLAWLVVVAPLNYFVTLLTGVVARQELARSGERAIAVQAESGYGFASIPWDQKMPDKAVDISLAAKPFAVTQAITALVLFIAKLFVD